MYVKLIQTWYGTHTIVNVKNIKTIECPLPNGGIGMIYMSLGGVEGHCWANAAWNHGNLCYPFSDVREIQTRSTLREDDEPWKTVWVAPDEFSNSPWYLAADLLRSLGACKL